MFGEAPILAEFVKKREIPTIRQQTHLFALIKSAAKIHSPVRVFLQHLIDADAEGFVVVAFMDEIFVYSKLGSSDRLALWDTGQVETEFSVMPSHWQELCIVLH